MSRHFDVLLIGSGPAGQKAAVQAAKAGKSVAVIERERQVGGECVQRGTIPSKTLREVALALSAVERCAANISVELGPQTKLRSLLRRLDEVLAAHQSYMQAQLERNGIVLRRGRARFRAAHELEVRSPRAVNQTLAGELVVIATGSRPRAPEAA